MALVRYELSQLDGGGAVATITMDDGKVNVMSVAMQAELNAALDRAEADRAVVLLTGREGVLSAGFDLSVLRAGSDETTVMVRGGFALAVRLLEFPAPVVVACPGHAIAMGVFLLLSGDYLIGAAGPYKFTANEVALGLAIPVAAIEILRQRLTPACLIRATALAEVFSPANAVAAGFLDRVVEPTELAGAAADVAAALAGLDRTAHAASKQRARAAALDTIRRGLAADQLALLSTVDA
jgi:enoyl-CoA hydratase